MRVDTFNRGGPPRKQPARQAQHEHARAVHGMDPNMVETGLLDPGAEQLGDMAGRFLEDAVCGMRVDTFYGLRRPPVTRRS